MGLSMPEDIKILINSKKENKEVYVADFQKEESEFVFSYLPHIDKNDKVAINMPLEKKSYIDSKMPSFFDMFIPEGYLSKIFNNFFSNNNKIDSNNIDFYIFSLLSANIEGRVQFSNDSFIKKDFQAIHLNDIKTNDTSEDFYELVKKYFLKNAISGVQPKTIAMVKDNTGHIHEYIIKTNRKDLPYMTENEYFCMQAVKKAGITTAEVELSDNKNFLIVKKFNDKYTGFEEVLGILGLSRDEKYNGSYENIAKLFTNILSNPQEELKIFFKLIVMNFLLGNGDAHLKNFGVLYDNDFTNIRLSPAYDVICSIPYIDNDKPALTLQNINKWYSKNILMDFGVKNCLLERATANILFEECENAVFETINLLKNYIKENKYFSEIGNKMILFWENYLKKNSTPY